MRCETCQGEGFLLRALAAVEIHWMPCPACHGSGQQSCCEGMCGGPGQHLLRRHDGNWVETRPPGSPLSILAR